MHELHLEENKQVLRVPRTQYNKPGSQPRRVNRIFKETIHEQTLSRARKTATGGKRIA